MVQGTDQAIDLLNKIIPAQRKIIGETINPDVTKVPQMWSFYKEIQNYYETGGLHAPDDITLLWAEDNNGNIRRLPTAEERKRSGGAGIYYHFDYHGEPTDYRWVNPSPIRVVDYGRTLSAMRGQGPVDFGPLVPPQGSPRLEYKTYFFTSGEATVYNVLAPNLAFIPGRNLRFAVSIDDQTPAMVTGVPTTIVAAASPRNGNE